MVKKKIIAIVQARLGSERFPDKVLQKLKSENVLSFLIKRLEKSKYINKVIVAIPKNKRNITLLNFLIKTKKNYFLGSEKDVLDRFYKASLNESPDYIVRITGDCPFVDPEIVDECIKKILDENYDYVSNINPPTFPDGFDVEVFSFSALKTTWKLASKKEDKEHVTKFMREHSEFNSLNIENNEDLSDLRMTLDYEEDLEVIKNIYNNFYPNLFFSFNEIIKFYKKNKKVFKKNMRFKRNTREVKNSGQILLKKAESLIPGSNMLLSKRSDMFLPGMWPAYYKKAKGCFVWDLDNKKYIDMSLMGVGTNILGYSHPEVNKAVSENIKKSNMSTLNCPEEVYLAENLVEMHPWAEMVKFARTGGEANSIAVRIARAASKKDKIAV